MDETQTMKEQMIQLQKMASLGMLSAGIAHEIQNPLNFVINFSRLSVGLVNELQEAIDRVRGLVDEDAAADIQDITDSLRLNISKIKEHGERAASVIQGILLISRGRENERVHTDIKHLLHEYVWLSYHAKRANDKQFTVTIRENYQPNMPHCMVIPQDLSRAVINIMSNACYAVRQRAKNEAAKGTTDFRPTISVEAAVQDGRLVISITDNGTGIPNAVQEKIFHQTVTTKPVGEGTGLGMQITHNIITQSHNGEIAITSAEGHGTTVTFSIPVDDCRERQQQTAQQPI